MSTAPFMPPERRAAIATMYVGGLGMDRADADMIIDLAVHAVQQAAEASARVAESAPNEMIAAQVLMLAAQLMEEQCKGYVETMRQMAREAGAFELSTHPV